MDIFSIFFGVGITLGVIITVVLSILMLKCGKKIKLLDKNLFSFIKSTDGRFQDTEKQRCDIEKELSSRIDRNYDKLVQLINSHIKLEV